MSCPRRRIAATMEAATSRAPSDFAGIRLRTHAAFCFGVPRAMSFPAYRKVFQQHEHVTWADSPGGFSAGFMCST
jgi:hypothetical protein